MFRTHLASESRWLFCLQKRQCIRWSLPLLDITQWSQLPLPVLVIVASYWVIQRLNDEFAKKLIELIGQFSEKYTAIITRADEDRTESRQRWLERDKLLITTLVENQKAFAENASQNHALRSSLQPLVLWWQREQRLSAKPPRQGDDSIATG